MLSDEGDGDALHNDPVSIEIQLSELEMLQSMYSSDELELDQDIRLFSETHQSELTPEQLARLIMQEQLRIGFLLKLLMVEHQVEIQCDFPYLYPSDARPNVYVRTSAFSSKKAQHSFRGELDTYIEGLELGEPIILTLIDWIRDAIQPHLKLHGQLSSQSCVSEECSFTRMWIYSHHIYSRFKRRDIINWSAELTLHGFSMCGKPGVICIEGHTDDIEEFWSRIRRLQWKRLIMKDREDHHCSNSSELKEHYKFDVFEEKHFGTRGSRGSHVSVHSDIGDLNVFMQEHGCGHLFEMFFGVEGKPVD